MNMFNTKKTYGAAMDMSEEALAMMAAERKDRRGDDAIVREAQSGAAGDQTVRASLNPELFDLTAEGESHGQCRVVKNKVVEEEEEVVEDLDEAMFDITSFGQAMQQLETDFDDDGDYIEDVFAQL